MKILEWFGRLRHIVRVYDKEALDLHKRFDALVAENKRLERDMSKLEHLVRQRTEIGTDIGIYGPSYVVVMGRYRSNDYVEIFSVEDRALDELVPMLKGMSKYGRITRVDTPVNMQHIFAREMYTVK